MRLWRASEGWDKLETRASPTGVPEEGAVAACRGVTLSKRRGDAGPIAAITDLYLPGLNMGPASIEPPFRSTGELKWLTTLVLADNKFACDLEMALAGAAFPALETLDLTGNAFAGPFPTELGKFKRLQVLKLGRNKLAGPIPSAWAALARLDTLDLHSNQLLGEALPEAFLRGCPRLRDYRAGDNFLDALHVEAPCSLRRLDLFGNEIRVVSPTISNLSKLCHLDLSKNKLAGALPVDALASIHSLRELYVRRADMSLMNRGGAAAATWMFRGDQSRRRRGRDVEFRSSLACASGT